MDEVYRLIAHYPDDPREHAWPGTFLNQAHAEAYLDGYAPYVGAQWERVGEGDYVVTFLDEENEGLNYRMSLRKDAALTTA